MLGAIVLGASLNWVDIVALFVVAAFFLYGVIRGFMLQVAGILVLVLALILASVTSGPLGAWLVGHFSRLTPVAARSISFLVVLLVTGGLGFALAHRLKGAMEKAKVLAWDHLLGGLLGIVKAGILIVVATQVFLNLTLTDKQQPEGISAAIVRSKTGRAVKWSSEKILVFLPRDISQNLRKYDRLH